MAGRISTKPVLLLLLMTLAFFSTPLFSFEGPYLLLASYSWSQVNGNSDAYMDPGETWQVHLYIGNDGDTYDSVNVGMTANYFYSCDEMPVLIGISPGTHQSVDFSFHIDESVPCGTIVCCNLFMDGGYGSWDYTCVFTETIGSGTPESSSAEGFTAPANSTSTLTLTPDPTMPVSSCTSAIAHYSGTNYPSTEITSAKLRHVESGNTYTLPNPPLNWAVEYKDVTTFYKANGPGTYQMEWVTSSTAAPIGSIGMDLTGNSYSCSDLIVDSCECTHPQGVVITDISSVDPCVGVQITFTAGSPATRNDLYVDGSLVMGSVSSPAIYNPGNTASHSYVIRSVNILDSCYSDSDPYLFADTANVPPSLPVITAVTDLDPYDLTGVQIIYTPGNPATSHDLYVDGTLVQSAFESGGIYQPSNDRIHLYTIHAVGGSCSGASNGVLGKDNWLTSSAPWAWGDNDFGQLGDGTTTRRWLPIPVSNLTGIVTIEGGAYHSLVLKSDGTIWAWGYNNYGQLGDGTITPRDSPVQVSGLTEIVAIAGCGGQSLALKSYGTVWAWGSNVYGQLGDGTTTDRTTPVQVSGLSGIIALAGGEFHSLALKSDGTVWAWGNNGYGQLGDGTTTNRTTPVQVSGLTGIVAVAGGSCHSLAIKSDGTVWAWGYNNYGQLGDGTTTTRTAPVQVSGLTGIIAIAGGSYHSLAIKSDGTVWAWGYNEYGQLGDGTTTTRSTPVQVSDLSGVTVVTGGFYHSLALKSEGTVWAWGRNNNGQIGDGTGTSRYTPVKVSSLIGIVAIACGAFHSLALFGNYQCAPSIPVISNVSSYDPCLGVSIEFTAGSPATRNDLYMDGSIALSSVSSPVIYNPRDTQSHSYVIRTTNVMSECYSDSCPYPFADTANANPSLPTITAVADLDSDHLTGVQITYTPGTPATRNDLYMDGTLIQSGFESGGICQPGDDRLHFYKLRAVNGSCSTDSAGMLGRDLKTVQPVSCLAVMAWGYNYYGQLGDGTTSDAYFQVHIPSLTGITAITGGYYHSLALKSDGTIWAWGYNSYGQLGDGTTTTRYAPVQVSGLTGIVAIAGGRYHSLAIKSDGTVWAWGYNNCGQLGDGSTASRTTPVQVSSLTGIVAIAAGYQHSLALKSDGTVWAWGYNNYGQLGDGTTATRYTPVQVSNLSGITAIASGYYHSLAIKSDGWVCAWGYNEYGQLGNGTITGRSTPIVVSSLNNTIAIAGGYYHSLAVKSDGSVWAMGRNNYGQLGDGTTTDRHTIVQVSDLTSAFSVAAGSQNSLALRSDGTLWAWGYNNHGQLGNGSTSNCEYSRTGIHFRGSSDSGRIFPFARRSPLQPSIPSCLCPQRHYRMLFYRGRALYGQLLLLSVDQGRK